MTSLRSHRCARLVFAGLVVAGATGTMSACGGGDKTSLKITESEPKANRYELKGVEKVKGGTVKVSLTNKGKVPHSVSLALVDGNHSQKAVTDALTKVITGMNQPLAPWLHPYGGVSGVKPGQTATATLVLPPGKYYALDTDMGQGDKAPPYFSQGAVKAFEAKGGKSTGTLPAAQQTVAIKDVPGDKFEFVNPPTLRSGRVSFALDNQSKKEFHHVVLAPLAPGKTLADARKFLATMGRPSGPPPVNFDAAVGTEVIEHNRKLVTDLNIPQPGNYVMLCFVQDRDGKGPPHVLKGLLKEVKVT